MMQSSWTLKENSTGELVVTVEGDAWEKAQKKVFKAAKNQITIKGFRKGQVPDALIRKQLGNDYLFSLAAEEVANDALRDGIKEHDLTLVDRPLLDIKEATKEAVVLSFTCTVSPEVTLGDYKGLDIHKAEVNVTDEDVQAELEALQSRYADWVLKEEGQTAENGDQVVIDFVGTKDGVPFEGGAGQEYPLELGSNTFIPGFEEQLVGVKSGDVKDVVVTFPEDYNEESLAGQEAVFNVTVHDIKAKELPEINDELVQRLKQEGVETVEQYKENKRTELVNRKEKQAEDEFENALMDQVTANAKVEIPEVMIQSEVDRMYRNFENQMQGSGFTAQQFLQATNQTEADLKANMVPEATKNVLSSLVLEAIIKQENIIASDEEAEEEYNKMAEQYQMDVAQIKAIISIDSIKGELESRKALDLIKSSVK
ncbi:trigger factor [Floccifex sp.]|uniref:trigger factor n=1 Tax=Floccifex sp. TaxID=2815810 RepID=UPI002A75F6C7|nr:trigger factor [Floccifex sp.]MDY2957561.1 trigger factor [Floccifex sp.]